MSMRDVIKSITDRIHDTASVKNVYGDPIVAQGKTVIPVAQVKYGFGGGGGQGSEPPNPENGGQASGGRMGVGGGGGASVKPIGVVEITADGTRYIPFGQGRRMVAVLAVGLLVGRWWARRRQGGRAKST